MKNTFYKFTFRRLRKNKYAWINLTGLALGLAVFMTLFLFFQHENSFEKSHTNLSNIYRLEQIKKDGEAVRKLCGTPPPLASVIDKDFPGILESTRMIKWQDAVIKLEDGSRTTVDNLVFADESFRKIFSYPIIKGSQDGYLSQPFMAIITVEYAATLFGTENPIGKKITYDDNVEVEIQSVVKSPTENSHLNFDLLISFETLVSTTGQEIINEDWFSNWCKNYVLLDDNVSAEELNGVLASYLKKYQGDESENILYLRPLDDIHLHSEVVDEFAQVGSYQNNLIYMVIAILIILIAGINYINLTIAYASNRIKEIGIKKVIGANRQMLIRQLLGESSISIIISMILALILIELFIPIFNTLVNRDLYVGYLENWQFITLFLSISIGVGIVTGFIPARIISGFQPLSMTKKAMLKGSSGMYFRHGLVLFQFFISISLISCTLILFDQYSFLKNKDLGYTKDNVMILPLNVPNKQKFDQFKLELEKLPGIEKVECSDYLPMASTNWTGFSWEGAEEGAGIKMNINYVGPEFTDVYDIQLTNGEGFKPEMTNRDQMYVLLNETAAKEIGWKDDPIGKEIYWVVDYRTRVEKKAIVVGITKDFHYLTKHQTITPLIMPLLNKEATGAAISIRLSPGNPKNRIDDISNVFHKIYPEGLFNFQFADEVVNNLYQSEQKMGKLVLSLTGLAIAIAIMGLTGLVTYTANQKTKEIGIRKVNGAKIIHILSLLSFDFVKLLLIAFVLSCPLSVIVMNIWMRNFAYKTSISGWTFVLTLVSMVIISLSSISYQTIKAALKNPVEALRYE